MTPQHNSLDQLVVGRFALPDGLAEQLTARLQSEQTADDTNRSLVAGVQLDVVSNETFIAQLEHLLDTHWPLHPSAGDWTITVEGVCTAHPDDPARLRVLVENWAALPDSAVPQLPYLALSQLPCEHDDVADPDDLHHAGDPATQAAWWVAALQDIVDRANSIVAAAAAIN